MCGILVAVSIYITKGDSSASARVTSKHELTLVLAIQRVFQPWDKIWKHNSKRCNYLIREQ